MLLLKCGEQLAQSCCSFISRNLSHQTNFSHSSGLCLINQSSRNVSYFKKIIGAHLVPKEHRNIRDNLFVLYASINEVINGRSSSFNIKEYNVVQCFDEM